MGLTITVSSLHHCFLKKNNFITSPLYTWQNCRRRGLHLCACTIIFIISNLSCGKNYIWNLIVLAFKLSIWDHLILLHTVSNICTPLWQGNCDVMLRVMFDGCYTRVDYSSMFKIKTSMERSMIASLFVLVCKKGLIDLDKISCFFPLNHPTFWN